MYFLILNRPPFETLRFVGELVMGFLFGLLIKVALPEDLLGGHDSPNLKYLDLIVPYAVATGIIVVVKPLLYSNSAA